MKHAEEDVADVFGMTTTTIKLDLCRIMTGFKLFLFGIVDRVQNVLAVIGILFLCYAFYFAVSVLIMFRPETNGELLGIAADANILVDSIYEYKNVEGKYPVSLLELSTHESGRLVRDKIFLNGSGKHEYHAKSRRWEYANTSGEAPFACVYIGNHGYVFYEFPPSSGYYYPPGENEGWVIRREDSARYLQSFRKTAK